MHVERIAAGGDGVARLADGRVVFVHGALPGEDVVVAVGETKRDFARGSVAEVITASPSRRTPPCPEVLAGCGGCGWQHVEPDAQLEWKVAVAVDALRRTAKLPEAAVVAGGRAGEAGYRTTMRLAVAGGRLGLRRERAHEVVAIGHCLVAHPALDSLRGAVRVRGNGDLTLRVSAATGASTVLAHGDVHVGEVPAGTGVGPDASLTEVVAGTELRVSAGSFFQSGPWAAELLVDAVRRAAAQFAAGPLVDAYGGVGLFAAAVATGPVTLVEQSPSSVADARWNLRDRPATVVQSAVESWRPTPHPLVIADPARAGLGKDGVAAVVAATPERIVLVSCDAVSMARDVGLLAAAGYRHARSEVLDLFPNTTHLEVVTTLDRAR